MPHRQARQVVLREWQGHSKRTWHPSDGKGQKRFARRKGFSRAIHTQRSEASRRTRLLLSGHTCRRTKVHRGDHGCRSPRPQPRRRAQGRCFGCQARGADARRYDRPVGRSFISSGKRPNYSTAAARALRRSFREAPGRARGQPGPQPRLFAYSTASQRTVSGAMAGATARYGSALFGWANYESR